MSVDRFKEHPRLLTPQGATYTRRYSLEHRGSATPTRARSPIRQLKPESSLINVYGKKRTIRNPPVRKRPVPQNTVRSKSKRSRPKAAANGKAAKRHAVSGKLTRSLPKSRLPKSSKNPGHGKSPLRGQRASTSNSRSRPQSRRR